MKIDYEYWCGLFGPTFVAFFVASQVLTVLIETAQRRGWIRMPRWIVRLLWPLGLRPAALSNNSLTYDLVLGFTSRAITVGILLLVFASVCDAQILGGDPISSPIAKFAGIMLNAVKWTIVIAIPVQAGRIAFGHGDWGGMANLFIGGAMVVSAQWVATNVFGLIP